ncbi:MAG: chemotaxis protein [Hahellaceae bacterium]|nr:chemotaxis protein [Hahellaceae bacterium]MCP5212883.1 chemotaxis protein [Hahellaceae bacterium]
MAQTSLAASAASFDLVKVEIEATINQAEQSLEHFQENRDSSEDLQNCIDFINQLRGIFVLVEIHGAVQLCQEAVSLANEVPVGATDDKNNLLTTLINSLFILRRYVEYFHKKREDHPELLLPIVNELRVARNAKPLPDSHFFELDFSKKFDICTPFKKHNKPALSDFDHHAKRLRHTYQIGLLGVLREANVEISLKLIAQACSGFSRLCDGAPLSQLWCLSVITVQAMLDRQMEITKSRKRLFMRVEKYTKELVYVGKVVTSKSAPDAIVKELVYMLALSGSHNEEVLFVLDGYGKAPMEFNERKLVENKKHLFGPGADVLKSLALALQEEITQLKDKLDIIERGIDPDVTDFSVIVSTFQRLADTLMMLNLSNLSELARKQCAVLTDWSEQSRTPTEDELMGIADAVLAVEQASQKIAQTGITIEADDIAHEENRRGGESPFLVEALIVVIGEAQSGIALTKRAITTYFESEYDKLHLANVCASLDAIRGSMQIIGEQRLAASLINCASCIQKELIDTTTRPEQKTLETLADILTSLEYYIESLAVHEKPNPELLVLTEESLKSIGYGS